VSEDRSTRDARLIRLRREAAMGGEPMSERDWNDYCDMLEEYRDVPEPEGEGEPEEET